MKAVTVVCTVYDAVLLAASEEELDRIGSCFEDVYKKMLRVNGSVHPLLARSP